MKNMKNRGRKEVTNIKFEGIARDECFVFLAECYTVIESEKLQFTDMSLEVRTLRQDEIIRFKVVSYVEGVLEIAVDTTLQLLPKDTGKIDIIEHLIKPKLFMRIISQKEN